MTVVINGTTGITSPEMALDNGAADGGQVVLKSSGFNNWNIDNYSGNCRFYYNATELMRIDSSGNVGIGTSSPTNKLDVIGAIQSGSTLSNNTGQANLSIVSNTGDSSKPRAQFIVSGSAYASPYQAIRANTATLYSAYCDLALNADTSNNIQFWTGSNERARIDSSGNLMVGTTGNSWGSLTGKFTAASTSGGAGIFYTSFSGDVSTAALAVGKYDNNNTTSQLFVRFGIGNGSFGNGQINGNGSGAAAFGSWSDQRIKENIADLSPQLANIMALRPVEFDYIESYGGGHQIGFIAQEMQQVFPDSVAEDQSEEKLLSVTGWSKTDARLIKAIQEQQALITQLQADVAALKGNA